MDFVKKEWQFRDIISENELNRMEDGIEEGITKAEQAQGTLNAHISRVDNPHLTTADQVGAPSLTKIVPDGTSLNTVTTSGFYRLGINHQDAPSGLDYGQMIVSRGEDTILQIVTGFNNNEFYIRQGNPPETGGSGNWQPWRRLWHEGNDGAGSGLSADDVDGYHANQLVKKNTENEITLRWSSADHSLHLDVDSTQDLPVAKAVDAYTVNGYLPDINSNPNTIVQRDANGDSKLATAFVANPGMPNDNKLIYMGTWGGNKAVIEINHNNDLSSQVNLRVQKHGGEELLDVGDFGFTYKGNNVWHGDNLPYEIGVWTPELRFDGSTAGITYVDRWGQYTRIANVVYWTFEFSLSSKGSASGRATIEGLPFNRGLNLNACHAVGNAINISVPSGQWLSSLIVGTAVNLATNTGSFISSAEFANNSELRASGFYFI